MSSDVVQFRESEETLAYLRERGVNPNEFGRRAFRAYYRRLRAQDAVDGLAGVKARLPRPVEDLVREDRDR